MSTGMLTIKNKELQIDIVNPANLDDKHFFSRYSYCGYIKQISHLATGRQVLDMPFTPFAQYHGEGFPEEFEMPINYDSVKKGGDFIKIGVGILKRGSHGRYSNEGNHPVQYMAPVSVKELPNGLLFSQGITVGDYGYFYEKKVRMEKGSSFSISHSIKNSGRATWKSLWYSHAFLVLGGHKKGLKFFNTPNCHETKRNRNLVETNGAYQWNGIFGKTGFCVNFSVKPGLPNYHKVIDADNKFSFEAHGDYKYQELQLYVNKRIFSPEPKLTFELKPDASINWSTLYSIKRL